jgi:hypothetical protein
MGNKKRNFWVVIGGAIVAALVFIVHFILSMISGKEKGYDGDLKEARKRREKAGKDTRDELELLNDKTEDLKDTIAYIEHNQENRIENIGKLEGSTGTPSNQDVLIIDNNPEDGTVDEIMDEISKKQRNRMERIGDLEG